MKSIIPVLLLFFIILGNTIENNNHDDHVNLPSYNDALKNNVLKNTEDIPPPSYQQAITRDYLYNNRYDDDIEQNINNMPIIIDRTTSKIMYIKYFGCAMAVIGSIALCILLIQYGLHKYK